MERTLSALVNDRPGVLARIAGLFSRRGYNIASITVGTAEDPGTSRMTIVSEGNDAVATQMVSQLLKLVDVLEVADISREQVVRRELALIKVATDKNTRLEISHILEPFRVSIVDVGHTSITVEITGDTAKVDALLQLLLPYGVLEIARTGVTALVRAAAIANRESAVVEGFRPARAR